MKKLQLNSQLRWTGTYIQFSAPILVYAVTSEMHAISKKTDLKTYRKLLLDPS